MPKPLKQIKNNPPRDAITVTDCSVRFGQVSVLENVSFSVKQGEIAAIIGPNGSGKSTLLRAILGLAPRIGDIKIFGADLHSVREQIGYVPQRFSFDRNFPITVYEFMDLARHAHVPKKRISEKIKEVGLPIKILETLLGHLSGGQLQRVLIAQAIINDPALLILDEAAAGVDIAGEQTFIDIIHHLNTEHQTTIILVSHDISMVSQLVNNVICINQKMLCYGSPRSALTAKKISELFGPHDTLYTHGHKHTHQ